MLRLLASGVYIEDVTFFIWSFLNYPQVYLFCFNHQFEMEKFCLKAKIAIFWKSPAFLCVFCVVYFILVMISKSCHPKYATYRWHISWAKPKSDRWKLWRKYAPNLNSSELLAFYISLTLDLNSSIIYSGELKYLPSCVVSWIQIPLC